MRAVLDTNVLISGVFFAGGAYEILKAWSDGRFELVLSEEILEEYLRVGEVQGAPSSRGVSLGDSRAHCGSGSHLSHASPPRGRVRRPGRRQVPRLRPWGCGADSSSVHLALPGAEMIATAGIASRCSGRGCAPPLKPSIV